MFFDGGIAQLMSSTECHRFFLFLFTQGDYHKSLWNSQYSSFLEDLQNVLSKYGGLTCSLSTFLFLSFITFIKPRVSLGYSLENIDWKIFLGICIWRTFGLWAAVWCKGKNGKAVETIIFVYNDRKNCCFDKTIW